MIRTMRDPMDEVYERFFGGPGFARRVAQRVRSLGSGFFVDAEGFILTNEHVVERAADMKISVSTFDGKTLEARYVRGEAERDLALIKVEMPEKAPYLDVRRLSPNLVGQTVIALGNPIGYESSVSAGILSGRNRTVGGFTGLLQTDAAINPGNSGGPLIDIGGRLVGVNSVKVSYAGAGEMGATPAENIGFAIPGEIVRDWVEEAMAIAKGERPAPEDRNPVEVLRERLGLGVQDLTPELAAALGYRMIAGVLIAEVEEGSPAAKAGIERGMVLQGVGPYAVVDVASIPREVSRLRAGSKAALTVVRLLRQGRVIYQQRAQVGLVAR